MMRTGFGAGMLLTPGLTLRSWMGQGADSPGARVAVRAAGIRDLALGIGTVLAADHGDDDELRRWLLFGAASDAVDALATFVAARRISTPKALMVVAAAGGAAYAGWRVAARL